MKKKKIPGVFALLCLFLATPLALYSCGSATGPTAAAPGGKVAVLLTDGPTTEFSKVKVTIAGIELISGGARANVLSGAQALDLLDLENETALLTLADVPAGTYEKIRLRVTGVELFGLDGEPVADLPVKLAGGGKIDLNPRGPFTVSAGETLTVRLDFDARKSLKMDRNKNMYVFRPVIFTEVEASAPSLAVEKLVRVTGTASNIDGTAGTFELALAGGGGPASINASNASFFNAGDYGNPAALSDLREGGAVTVIGTMAGGAVEAAVVMLGTFDKVSGTIVSGVDPLTGRFEFLPDSDFGPVSPYSVALQEGTGIYSGAGEALDETAITEGARAEIDGVFLYMDLGPPVLNAAFVSVDAGPDDQELSATVSGASVAAVEPCVSYARDAVFLLITSTAEMAESRYIESGDIQDGEEADIYGRIDPVSGCLVAETVIVERAM